MQNDISEIFTVPVELADIRLDKLLALHFPQHSRTYFQFLIESGSILVNGQQLKKREKAKPGDEIEVCFLLTPEMPLEAEDIPLDILYEDDDLIIVNKPPNMVVHPAPGHPSGTFVNALLHHCKALGSADPLRPGIVHRLDKDTSGALVAAKTPFAHARLVSLFSERKVKKKYIAICVGTPKEGLIDAPIARHPLHRQQMAICPEKGKEAKTIVRILAKTALLSCLELELISGRTHQIRVHMKHLGTPVLGDLIYGSQSANKKFNSYRQLLHAHSLCFPHPVHGNEINITAPIPQDLASFIEQIK
jgi:23S rRNA pseudouridine1911/1915/1917 synthase